MYSVKVSLWFQQEKLEIYIVQSCNMHLICECPFSTKPSFWMVKFFFPWLAVSWGWTPQPVDSLLLYCPIVAWFARSQGNSTNKLLKWSDYMKTCYSICYNRNDMAGRLVSLRSFKVYKMIISSLLSVILCLKCCWPLESFSISPFLSSSENIVYTCVNVLLFI